MDLMQQETEKLTGRQKKTLVLGIIVTIFTIIGIVTTIVGIVSGIADIFDHSELEEEFERTVFPIMIQDPAPFETIDKADNRILLRAAIYETLILNDADRYEIDEEMMTIIPLTDIEVSAVKLFGKDVKITYGNAEDEDFGLYYDEENKLYRVPSASEANIFTPDVQSITKKGDVYTVEVGYVPPNSSWYGNIFGEVTRPETEKTMVYILKHDGSNYIITGLQFPEDVTSSDASSATSSEEESTSDSSGDSSADSSDASSGAASGDSSALSSGDSSGASSATSSGAASSATSSKK